MKGKLLQALFRNLKKRKKMKSSGLEYSSVLYSCAHLATDNLERTADVSLVATSNATSDINGGDPPSTAE